MAKRKKNSTKKKAGKRTNIPDGKRLVAVKYRICPDGEAARFFACCFGCCRKYWNTALDDWNRQDGERKALPEKERKSYHMHLMTPRECKEEMPFMREADSLALANTQMDLLRAFRDGFSGDREMPKHKKKKYGSSYTTNNQNGTVRIEDGMLVLPKCRGKVRIRMHRCVDGIIRSVTISLSPSGKWHASVLFMADAPESAQAKAKLDAVGDDFGVKRFITDSEGGTADPARFFRDMEERIAKEQRKLARMRARAVAEGRNPCEGKNYQKQQKKVAKLCEKAANRRADFLHKLSRSQVDAYDIICIEDLCIKGMMANRHLAKSVGDAGWSMFVNMLEYKAERAGKTVVKVGRWFPSTQTCSDCGCVLRGEKKLTLKDREWTCPECGAWHDRDVNAAINIKNEGIRIYTASLVESGRPVPVIN